MSSVLMKSVSGIRGIVGSGLTPELPSRVGAAFARYCGGGTIVVGRDSRPTGPVIEDGLVSALRLSGCRVVLLGVVPTPTVQIMVEHLHADGGIIISASHNPIQWNAFKLVSHNGSFLNEEAMKRFLPLIDGPCSGAGWNAIGGFVRDDTASTVHRDLVLKVIDADAIRRRKFRVVLDSVNGAGSLITQEFLGQLGCEVYPIHCDPMSPFPRGAEPLPENLGDLSAEVVARRADIGFAQDPDADRLAIVDDRGRPIGEEYTIALVCEHLLSSRPGRVVVNLSTTAVVDTIAALHGSRVVRSKVGEINVVEEMRREPTRIGGEGNGGVISPEIHLGRDSLAGIAYVLEMMAHRDASVSQIVSALPSYVMIKGKVPADGMEPGGILADIARKFAAESISSLDGLRIDFTARREFLGGWVHLRSSNTEPIFRIIAEGKNEVQARAIYDHFFNYISSSR